jgi:hypothetical protein
VRLARLAPGGVEGCRTVSIFVHPLKETVYHLHALTLTIVSDLTYRRG